MKKCLFSAIKVNCLFQRVWYSGIDITIGGQRQMMKNKMGLERIAQ